MDTKKDIGKAIKDNLSNLKETPSNHVWENIELELKKEEKDDYIIPFWFKYGSVAILLLLIAYLFTNLETANTNTIKSTTTNPKITTTTKEPNSTLKTINSNNNNNNNNSVVTSTNASKVKNNKPVVTNYKYNKKQTTSTFANTKISTINNSFKALASPNTNTQKLHTKKDANTNIVVINKPIKKGNNLNTFTAENKLTTINNKNSQQENNTKTVSPDSIVLNKKDALKEELITNLENKTYHQKEEELTEEQKTNKKKSSSKWQVMPFLSGDYYGSFNTARKKNITLNHGIYLTYKASEDISIRIGAKPVTFKFTENLETGTINKVIKYTEIPLEVKYLLYDNYIDTSVIFGLSYLLLENDETYSNNTIVTNYDQPFNTTNISLNGGFNFERPITKRFSLNLESTFKLHLNTFKKASNNSVFNVSAFAGIQYSF